VETPAPLFYCTKKYDKLQNGEVEMMPKTRPFLTAEWRFLLMLNYEVPAAVLQPFVPAGTELDLWDGKALVSVVGFLFQHARVLGAAVPFHSDFEEINLRFYVRRLHGEDLRRGVCFIKEIVPKPWIARTARWLYQENYIALPMGHTIEGKKNNLGKDGLVEYTWRYQGKINRLGGLGIGEPSELQQGTEEEFLSEHYWGYTRLSHWQTGEYQVEHPRWRIWKVAQPFLLCDVANMYGEAFAPFLRRRPRSAFLAEGSPVKVFARQKLHFQDKRRKP
jgi:uncharacterized protein